MNRNVVLFELSEIMAEVDKEKLPIILLDHEPFNLDVSEQAGVDLQFSGHTHLGQLYPNNFITRSIFENDWGYLRKNTFQLIVSCGYGTYISLTLVFNSIDALYGSFDCMMKDITAIPSAPAAITWPAFSGFIPPRAIIGILTLVLISLIN